MDKELIIGFINNNIIVDRFPVSKEIQADGKHHQCQVIINVSDEFYLGNSEQIMEEGKLNYYFPMGEDCESMGLNSIYGALQVLYNIYVYKPDWKVLLHCQAGGNRSPTIKAAFYYMMLGEHLPEERNGGIITKSNQLLHNIEKNHLPSKPQMELFLSKCKYAFDNSGSFLGGMFDWVLVKSGCSTRR